MRSWHRSSLKHISAPNAASVYQRVIELDPQNSIAREKLEPQAR